VLSAAWRFSPGISTGVGEASSEAPFLFPNPTSDLLQLATVITGTYTIVDAAGVVVASGTLQRTVDVAVLADGMYLLVVEHQGLRKAHRFVVKR